MRQTQKHTDTLIAILRTPTVGEIISKPAIERVQALADISLSALYAFAVYKVML